MYFIPIVDHCAPCCWGEVGGRHDDIVLVGKVLQYSGGDVPACTCCKAVNKGGEVVLRGARRAEGRMGKQENCRP